MKDEVVHLDLYRLLSAFDCKSFRSFMYFDALFTSDGTLWEAVKQLLRRRATACSELSVPRNAGKDIRYEGCRRR